MAHRSTGLRGLLDHPRVYERFQRLLGARDARVRLVSEFLQPWKGARVLDVGCGTGSFLDVLPSGIEYVGFDPNRAYIEEARRRYGGRGMFSCAGVGAATGELDDDSFDVVIAKSVLHHLDDDEARHLVTTAKRILRPGGVFFSSDVVRHERQPLFARALAALDRGGNVRRPEGYRALVTPHFPAVETWLLTDLLPVPYSHFVMRAKC